MDTAVGAEETGPAAGHISCFILKGSIRNKEEEVISGLLLSFIFKMFIIKYFQQSKDVSYLTRKMFSFVICLWKWNLVLAQLTVTVLLLDNMI